MQGTITVTKGVEHNDADAAGWDKGWTWQLDDDLGTFHGAHQSKADAITEATAVAVSHGCQKVEDGDVVPDVLVR